MKDYKKTERNKESYFGSVRFFKNMILIAVIIMILTPSIIAVHFRNESIEAEKELGRIKELYNESLLWYENGGDSPYSTLYPDFYAPQKVGKNSEDSSDYNGTVYLTFDDGPSDRTDEILDILAQKNVKATFFVVGCSGDVNEERMRRIVSEGHTLGMHSYSHNYNKIYGSVEAYLDDMYEVFSQIRDVTGEVPTAFRFPGGSINGYNTGIYQELISEMMRRGFIPYDWNISSQDAAVGGIVSEDDILNNVLSGAGGSGGGIVLMHDSQYKITTVNALGSMIDSLMAMGYELKPITPELEPMLFAYIN